jgi:Arc/MetJ-type ribon-helix-helix transcriptional regulator
MNVELTPEQHALIKRAIDGGRFSHEQEPVQDALSLWCERERKRLDVLTALDDAEASLARGEGRTISIES